VLPDVQRMCYTDIRYKARMHGTVFTLILSCSLSAKTWGAIEIVVLSNVKTEIYAFVCLLPVNGGYLYLPFTPTSGSFVISPFLIVPDKMEVA